MLFTRRSICRFNIHKLSLEYLNSIHVSIKIQEAQKQSADVQQLDREKLTKPWEAQSSPWSASPAPRRSGTPQVAPARPVHLSAVGLWPCACACRCRPCGLRGCAPGGARRAAPVGGRSACTCAAALRGCAPGEARRLRPAAVPARALRGCSLRGRALGAQAAAGGTRESGSRPAGGS